MFATVSVGVKAEESCFPEVLRNFGYESALYETEAGNLNQILTKVKKDDCLMMQGDLSGISEKDLVRLLKQLHKEGVHVILSGSDLSWKKIARTRPFLMVVHQKELEKEYHEIRNENDAMRILVNLHDHSHGNVLMVLDREDKAVFVCADGREFVSVLPYEKKETDRYAQDSMIAGFLAAFESFHDYVKTFHYALSAHSISAWTGKPAGREETEDTYQRMKEKKIWMK